MCLYLHYTRLKSIGQYKKSKNKYTEIDNVKNVQENLGHATPAFTLERYASITSDMLEESRRNNQTVIDRLGI